MILVGNSEIEKALEKLISMDLPVESTSATAYTAFEKIKDKLQKLKVLVPLRGSGLRLK